MTDDMMNLRWLVEKSADADLLPEMIGFAADNLMELEVGAKTGAGYGKKNAFRLASSLALIQARLELRVRHWRAYCHTWSPIGKVNPAFTRSIYHRLEPLYVVILIEETPRELLVVSMSFAVTTRRKSAHRSRNSRSSLPWCQSQRQVRASPLSGPRSLHRLQRDPRSPGIWVPSLHFHEQAAIDG